MDTKFHVDLDVIEVGKDPDQVTVKIVGDITLHPGMKLTEILEEAEQSLPQLLSVLRTFFGTPAPPSEESEIVVEDFLD